MIFVVRQRLIPTIRNFGKLMSRKEKSKIKMFLPKKTLYKNLVEKKWNFKNCLKNIFKMN
ncbi:hypothetical protein C1646_723049 [Rhizophagus diaphanus]|nr:hypothetical protein C1646_723049 [Rhizophagus diaphanus] [Rhizophagus sp. MUCL 43196]